VHALAATIDSFNAAIGSDDRLALLKALAAVRDGRGTTGTYAYEHDMTALAVSVPGLPGLAEQLLAQGEGDGSLRFLYVTIVFNWYRRQHHPGRASATLGGVEAEFNDVPLFLHYRAMSMVDGSIGEMRRGLELAERAHKRLPDHAGIAHTCAVLIADLASNDGFTNPRPELERGLGLVNEAIEGYPNHARFYHTRARLLRLLRDYDRARIDIVHAIDIEDRDSSDIQDRLAAYYIERSMIDADRSIARLAKAAEESNNRLTEETHRLKIALDASQIQAIEVIGFVAAILGLILATMGEIRNQSPLDALTVLAGVAILLFGVVFLGSWLLRRGIR